MYAGLVGAIVIGRKGELKEDLTAKDVDREVVLFFSVVNEVMSLYADENAEAMGFTDIEGEPRWAGLARPPAPRSCWVCASCWTACKAAGQRAKLLGSVQSCCRHLVTGVPGACRPCCPSRLTLMPAMATHRPSSRSSRPAPAAWESVAEAAFEAQATSDQQLALATEQQAAALASPPPARTAVTAPAAATTPGTTQAAVPSPEAAPGLGRRLLAALAKAQRAQRRLLEEEEEEGYEEPMLKHVINGGPACRACMHARVLVCCAAGLLPLLLLWLRLSASVLEPVHATTQPFDLPVIGPLPHFVGFLYCNMPVLGFTQGEAVRFHIMALGTEGGRRAPPASAASAAAVGAAAGSSPV